MLTRWSVNEKNIKQVETERDNTREDTQGGGQRKRFGRVPHYYGQREQCERECERTKREGSMERVAEHWEVEREKKIAREQKQGRKNE